MRRWMPCGSRAGGWGGDDCVGRDFKAVHRIAREVEMCERMEGKERGEGEERVQGDEGRKGREVIK